MLDESSYMHQVLIIFVRKASQMQFNKTFYKGRRIMKAQLRFIGGLLGVLFFMNFLWADTCICLGPGRVDVVCDNNAWSVGIVTKAFPNGITSTHNSRGYSCAQRNIGLYFEVREKNGRRCKLGPDDAHCNAFCTNQFSKTDEKDMRLSLKQCVDYYAQQCRSHATTIGGLTQNYGGGHRDPQGWFVIYGLCSI